MSADMRGALVAEGGASPAAWWTQLSSGATADERMKAWLALQCAMLPKAVQGVLVLGAPDTGPYAPRAVWPAESKPGEALAHVAEQSLAQRTPLLQPIATPSPSGPAVITSYVVAFPVDIAGALHGVVAVQLAPLPEADLQRAMRDLQWGMAWVASFIQQETDSEGDRVRERLMIALDVIASVLQEEKYDGACRALVTELALRFNCDRVSMGLVRNQHVSVVAISHSADFTNRMNLVNAIGLSMDEALDQKSVILHPGSTDDGILVTRDHERLAREHGSGSILTVPFAAGEEFTGALTLERPGRDPFDESVVELCQSAMAIGARILSARKSAERPLARRVLDAMRDEFGRLIGPRYIVRKLILASIVGVCVFFSVATGTYRVTGTSTVEGAVRRTLVAPFDGYVASAAHRAGDLVRAKAVMAMMDDRDLRVERTKFSSQYAQYAKQYQEAIASRDRAKAQIAQAQAEQARAQMIIVESQMSRAAIIAPFDGIVTKGDFSQSLGSAVKRGDTLFEIAPLDAYRVIVQVDEADIADVRTGQEGFLVLSSIADDQFPFKVTNVTPVTTVREGRNFFRIEASLVRTSESLRPGMEGVGKIEIGERSLAWIWGRRLINWARLFFWTWWP